MNDSMTICKENRENRACEQERKKQVLKDLFKEGYYSVPTKEDYEEAIEWVEKDKGCHGCHDIWFKINYLGHDGVWDCPVCGREIEWGT